jgi:AcrR family transcriptional regulator
LQYVINPHILFVKREFERRTALNEPSATKTGPIESAAPRGRAPTQRRSIERVERILACATALIAERGSDQMKMSEVAEMAEISIGSLYQYFPDKSAIIHALAERLSASSRACIEAALLPVRDLGALRAAFSSLVDQYYAIFLSEPVMRDIWSATQADKRLQDIELAESRACGKLLADILVPLRPDADAAELTTSAFLVWQLGEATMRLAISLDGDEGAAVVAAYKRMALRELLNA